MPANFVVLDFDGVMLDSMPTLTEIAVEELGKLGIEQGMAREQYERTSGAPFERQLDLMYLKMKDPRVREARDSFERRKREAYPTMGLMTGMRAFLRSASVPVGVASSTESVLVEEALAERGMLRYVELEGGDGTDRKDRQIVRLCSRLGIDRKDTLFVGDSERDGGYAASAGVSFMRFGPFDLYDVARVLRA